MRASVLMLLLCAACSSVTGVELDEEFAQRVGEQATVQSVDLTIRFETVAQDSRCPLRAECVWAGDAAVVLTTWTTTEPARVDTLHTGLEPSALVRGGVTVELIGLDPHPEVPGSIAQARYRARLVVRPLR